MCKPDIDRLIVVCGVGRSGTSLLQSMLNAHPEICFPPETHFFREYVSGTWRNWRLSKVGPVEFADVLSSNKYFSRLGLSVDKLMAPYVAGKRLFDVADVYRRMLFMYASRQKCPRVGDKDPRIIDYLGSLGALFPQALLIQVIRDPRDVLLSRMKAKWSSTRPWWLHIFIYRAQLFIGRRVGRRVFCDRYIEVRYEDLISRPEESLKELCHFIGISFDRSMLDFSESASRLISEDEIQWKKETLGPLLSNNTEKWRGELSPWRIRLTEAICSEAFTDLGYCRASEDIHVNPVLRAIILVVRPLGWAFTAVYRLRLLVG